MSETKKRETKKKEVKKITFDDMKKVMSTFDSDVFNRMTTNNDICAQVFDGAKPKTRCELWKRSETHYDLYIGNETNVYKFVEARKHLTYIDDKKMSKNEIMFKFISKDAFEKVKKFVDEIDKKMKKEADKTTKEVNESEKKAE